LSLFFLLSGLTLFVNCLNSFTWAKVTGSILFFVAAMFSKENMVIFFPLTALITLYFHDGKLAKFKRWNWILIAGFATLSLTYIGLKFTVFNFSDTSVGLTEATNDYTKHVHIRLITFVHSIWEYVKFVFFPNDLFYEKSYLPITTLKSANAVFGLFVVGLFIAGMSRLKRKPKLFLALGWIAIAITPFMGIIPLNAMYLEHWMYIPMVGIAMLFAGLCDYLIRLRLKTVILFLSPPLLIGLAFLTVKRNKDWNDIERFYKNELAHTKTVRMANNLGMYYAEKNDYRKAISYYGLAAQSSSNKPQPHHNLARIYVKIGRDLRKSGNIPEHVQAMNSGINTFLKGLLIDPNFKYSLEQLYLLFDELKMEVPTMKLESLVLKSQAGERINRYEILEVNAKYNLGKFYSNDKNYTKAINYYEEQLKTDKTSQLYYEVAMVYAALRNEAKISGNTELETKYIDKCLNLHYEGLKIDPNFTASLIIVHAIYKAYNVGIRTEKVQALIQRRKKGETLVVDDIVKAMEQEFSN